MEDPAATLCDNSGPSEGTSKLARFDLTPRSFSRCRYPLTATPSATLLLTKGAAADAIAGGGDDTLLHAVCGHELPLDVKATADGTDLRLAQLLLSHGATLNAPNGKGETPLDVSFFRGSAELSCLLLSQGIVSTLKPALHPGPE